MFSYNSASVSCLSSSAIRNEAKKIAYDVVYIRRNRLSY